MSIYPLPALPAPLLAMPFTTKETTGWTNEVAKRANKDKKNPGFFCFIFSVSVAPSNYTPESSNEFMILVISFIYSFDKNVSS